jgi:hypothetical protein
MKRFFPLIFLVTAFFIVIMVISIPSGAVQALPEYSAQVGEPCASCHISPSGGGPRGPRGQAWVAAGKPGYVPAQLESLEMLGVNLDFDPDAYTIVPDVIPPAEPLRVEPGESRKMHEWLRSYPGN